MGPVDQIAGVILSGGQSTRMGEDKGLLLYDGRKFIQIVADQLKKVFSEVVIISDLGGKYRFTGLPVYGDLKKGMGPLAGIMTALSILKKDIFVVSSDLPMVNSGLILSLVNKSREEEVTLFSVGGHLQPLFALYKYRCLEKIKSDLSNDKLSVYKFIEQSVKSVYEAENFENQDISPLLLNINTPDDYQALLRRRE